MNLTATYRIWLFFGLGLFASAPGWCDDWELNTLLPKVVTVTGFLDLLEHPEAEEELFNHPELLRKICHQFIVVPHPVVENPTDEEISRAILWAKRLLSTDTPSERWTAGSHLLFLYGQQPNLELLETALANFGKLARVAANPGVRRRRTSAFLPKPLTDDQIASFEAVLTGDPPNETQSRVRKLLRQFSDLHISTSSMRTTSQSYLKLVDVLIGDAVRSGDADLEFILDRDVGRERKQGRFLLEALLDLVPRSPPAAKRLVRFARACTPRWWEALRSENNSLYLRLLEIAPASPQAMGRVGGARPQLPIATSLEDRRRDLMLFLEPRTQNATAMGEFHSNTAREWQIEIGRWQRQSVRNSATVAKLMLLLFDPPNWGTAEVAAELLETGFVTLPLARACRFAEFLELWFESNPNPPSRIRAPMLRAVSAVFGESVEAIQLQLKILGHQGINRTIQGNLRSLRVAEIPTKDARQLLDSVEQLLAGDRLQSEARVVVESLKARLVSRISCPSLVAKPST